MQSNLSIADMLYNRLFFSGTNRISVKLSYKNLYTVPREKFKANYFYIADTPNLSWQNESKLLFDFQMFFLFNTKFVEIIVNIYFQAKSGTRFTGFSVTTTRIWLFGNCRNLEVNFLQLKKTYSTTFFKYSHQYCRSIIPIIFIGFFSLANQRFITDNWTPYIFISVVSFAVWAWNQILQMSRI